MFDKLPCIVVVDAVPAKSLCVIKLDKDVTSSLLTLLRKTIAEFHASAGSKTIRRDAERLLEIQTSISNENTRDATLRGEVNRATETINKLKAKIKAGNSTASTSYLEQILQKRESERQRYMAELEELPHTLPERLAALDAELQEALREHRRYEGSLFSKVFERQVRALGLQAKLSATRMSTLGFIGNLLKPEFLLKVWGMVSQ